MGKIYGTLVICAVILFLCFLGTATAKTWYVDDDGRADFETIQGAIFDRNVTDRDTIIIRAGTYIENVDVNKSLTIKSNQGAGVTIVQANDPNDYIFWVYADYVTISGFRVEGSDLPGIQLDPANHCNISNNYITKCDIGIASDRSHNNRITNNHCIRNVDNGIDLDYSSNNSVTNNICSHNIGNGIDLSRSYYNSIANNTCSLNVDSGIDLDNSNNNSITNNTCKDSMKDSIDLWFSNNNIIYLNNFVTEAGDFDCFNSINAWNTTEDVTYSYNGSTYRNYLGNYWGDPIRADADGNGICDDPFIIDGDQDNYPLAMPVENYIIK
jgi:nitrous oxidase accessory protein